MILDSLENAGRYAGLHPLFPRAFDFLRDLSSFPGDGVRHVIDDDRLYVLFSSTEGRGREASPLEFHRKYIDIQYVIRGADCIGVPADDRCPAVKEEYDPARDIGFYAERPGLWVPVPERCFMVLFPSEAHAPLAGEGRVSKAVVKVLLR